MMESVYAVELRCYYHSRTGVQSGSNEMKINNLHIHHSPDAVVADLLFSVGKGVVPAVRPDQFCDTLLDCLHGLDRDGAYTFHNPQGGSMLRLVRNGEELLVQSDAKTRLPDAPHDLKYSELRAAFLVALDLYRDQLEDGSPSHPETRRFRARLEAAKLA